VRFTLDVAFIIGVSCCTIEFKRRCLVLCSPGEIMDLVHRPKKKSEIKNGGL